MARLPYPVYDADNHLYEPEEAMTAHLPRKWKNEFRYVEVEGRTKLAIGGVISDYIPNPTFDVLAAPGAHEKWYRATNHDGLIAARALRQADRLPVRLSQRRRAPEADGRAGRPRHAGLPDARLRGRRAHELRPRADERRDPLAQPVDGRGVGLRARGAPLRGAVRDADGRGHGRARSSSGRSRAARARWACARRRCRATAAAARRVRRSSIRSGRASQEAGIFVSMHASDSGYDRFLRMWEGGKEFLAFAPTPLKQCLAVQDRAIADALAALICHGVFDRFPGVRVASIENGSKWVRGAARAPRARLRPDAEGVRAAPARDIPRATSPSPPSTRSRSTELAELIGVVAGAVRLRLPAPRGPRGPARLRERAHDARRGGPASAS